VKFPTWMIQYMWCATWTDDGEVMLCARISVEI